MAELICHPLHRQMGSQEITAAPRRVASAMKLAGPSRLESNPLTVTNR